MTDVVASAIKLRGYIQVNTEFYTKISKSKRWSLNKGQWSIIGVELKQST